MPSCPRAQLAFTGLTFPAVGWQEAAADKGSAVGLPLLAQNVGKDKMAPARAAPGVFQNSSDDLY